MKNEYLYKQWWFQIKIWSEFWIDFQHERQPPIKFSSKGGPSGGAYFSFSLSNYSSLVFDPIWNEFTSMTPLLKQLDIENSDEDLRL